MHTSSFPPSCSTYVLVPNYKLKIARGFYLTRSNPLATMSGQRVLLPATAAAGASRTVDVTPANAGGPIARRQGREGEQRHRHTTQEWDDVKKSIEEVYFREDATLEDVKEELKRDCGFEARYVETV